MSCVAVLLLNAAVCCAGQVGAPGASITPGKMAKIATIDERFQSYNIEAVEVTGGRFWKPFAKAGEAKPVEEKPSAATAMPGMDPSLYEYRAPIDLSNKRLRRLAAALGPAYVRVSGTWMNSTYFQEPDAPAPVGMVFQLHERPDPKWLEWSPHLEITNTAVSAPGNPARIDMENVGSAPRQQ